MPELGDDSVMPLPDSGRLLASHADREHVIDVLKDAFVQDRLTKDEFDARVGHAFAGRTRADLALLTADLPAVPPLGPPAEPGRPWRPENTSARNSARVVAAAPCSPPARGPALCSAAPRPRWPAGWPWP